MSAKKFHIVSDIPESLLSLYLSKDCVAIDTEMHGLNLLRDKICLVQVCDDEQNVCLVAPKSKDDIPNLKKLLYSKDTLKIFHFALTDVAFFKKSLEIDVKPFICTKVMSKLVRTYTEKHGLKDVTMELLGVELSKEQQQTNWASSDLSSEQLQYAVNDVLYLVPMYLKLKNMIESRGILPTGASLISLNEKAQSILPSMIELLVHGYGDLDRGWQTSLFQH